MCPQNEEGAGSSSKLCGSCAWDWPFVVGHETDSECWALAAVEVLCGEVIKPFDKFLCLLCSLRHRNQSCLDVKVDTCVSEKQTLCHDSVSSDNSSEKSTLFLFFFGVVGPWRTYLPTKKM